MKDVIKTHGIYIGNPLLNAKQHIAAIKKFEQRGPLIINVRGNSGSGKTMLTRQFLSLIRSEPARAWSATWDNGWDEVGDYKGQDWVVLGSYDNTCGGVDTIHTQAEIIERIKAYKKDGFNIWLEGLLISGMYGSLGEFSEQFGDRWVFAFLNTPLKTCLKHVQQRRKAAGNKKPFNPSNTINRHDTIIRTRERLLEKKRRVIDLPWQDALAPLLKIIRREV